jgi:hypothetical protein
MKASKKDIKMDKFALTWKLEEPCVIERESHL